MKNFLASILLGLITILQTTAYASTDLDYHFDIKPKVMHVKLNYRPVLRDSTVFQYGNEYYGGMKDLLKGLINIQASVTFKVDSAKSQLTFYHPQNIPIQIQYDIIDTHTPQQKVRGEMFRPIITDNYFFSLSHSLFLNPQVDEKRQASMMMSVTLEKKPTFPMYFSFAPTLTAGKTVTIKFSEGMNALVTGASDLHIVKRKLAGIQNYVVLRINQKNPYNLKRFMDYFDKFLPAMTDFWGNLNGTYYSLIASPFLDIKYHNISGTAFNSGFHVKYSGDTILANEEVVTTISHEIMHRYIGAGYVSMGENNQWFDEGFTDYTTWYLLAKAGIFSEQKLAKMVKDTYQQLSANPVKNTANGDILKHFWENHNYEKIPYHRGALFAAYLNKRITEESQGTKSYQDFLRSLKALAEQKKQLLTIEDFIAVASAYIPKAEIEASIQQYIMKGEMIEEERVW